MSKLTYREVNRFSQSSRDKEMMQLVVFLHN